jgi:hypothetical protein
MLFNQCKEPAANNTIGMWIQMGAYLGTHRSSDEYLFPSIAVHNSSFTFLIDWIARRAGSQTSGASACLFYAKICTVLISKYERHACTREWIGKGIPEFILKRPQFTKEYKTAEGLKPSVIY